jgi:NADH-quinone oxidoreductase subunit N
MPIDFTRQTDYLWAMLPEVVLSVWAMFVLLVDVFQKEDRSAASSPLITWLTLLGLALAGAANIFLMTLQETSAAGIIAIDAFRVFANFLFLLAAALCVLISTSYLERENMRLGELYVLLMLATVGMMVFAGARDLMIIFLGLELMSVPVYVLTGANRRDPRSAEGALKYFLLGAFSSAFFLFGIALVFGGAGTTNISTIGTTVGLTDGGTNSLLAIGMGLLAVGFGFKVAAVPFHMWTPDAYEGAPAPVTAFMAAGVKAAAFAAFLRVFMTAFPGLYDTWSQMLFWLAAASMVVANLIALVEGNVKRMLAYSSIAHAGYLLVALASGSVLGAASYLFYLVVYTLMTVGSFAIVQVVGRKGETRVDLEAYSGLGWQNPLAGILMTIFLLSLAGFPLTGGFIGKVFILRAAVESDMVPLAVLLVLTSLLSYWYYLRVAWYMWFSDPSSRESYAGIEVTGTMKVALVAAAIGIVVLGILPGQLLGLAERSAAALSSAPALLGLVR